MLDAFRACRRGLPSGGFVCVVPTGGLRTGIDPGPVTYGEIFSVQPSGRELIRVGLSGIEVRQALEAQYGPDRDHLLAVSGPRYAHDPTRPPGHRVTSLTLNGFLAAGGGEFGVFARGENRRVVGTDICVLARHAGRATQPFVTPALADRPRVRLGG